MNPLAAWADYFVGWPGFAGRLGFILAASVLAAAGALGLAAWWSGGLYLLPAATLASLAIGLVIARVLLVEVRRLATQGPEG